MADNWDQVLLSLVGAWLIIAVLDRAVSNIFDGVVLTFGNQSSQ